VVYWGLLLFMLIIPIVVFLLLDIKNAVLNELLDRLLSVFGNDCLLQIWIQLTLALLTLLELF
jgi:hypothetical protein